MAAQRIFYWVGPLLHLEKMIAITKNALSLTVRTTRAEGPTNFK